MDLSGKSSEIVKKKYLEQKKNFDFTLDCLFDWIDKKKNSS
jgi:hypothetical protein